MEKDIFSYIINPGKKFFRQVCFIDKLYNVKEYILPQKFDLKHKGNISKFLINDSIMNYKNEILNTKIQYMTALNYEKLIVNENTLKDREQYDFLARLYFENTIIHLFSAFDKTYDIFNNIFDLNINSDKEKTNFKKIVAQSIPNDELKEKLRRVYEKLQEYSNLRNEIVHSKSKFYARIIRNNDDVNLNMHVQHELTLEEIKIKIEKIVEIIFEEINVINELII